MKITVLEIVNDIHILCGYELLDWSNNKRIFKINRLLLVLTSLGNVIVDSRKGVVSLIDDSVVTGKTGKEHFRNMKMVF